MFFLKPATISRKITKDMLDLAKHMGRRGALAAGVGAGR
jgi:hypothetical protein